MIEIFLAVCCGCFSHVVDDCMYIMWMVCIVTRGESPLNIIAVQMNQSAIVAHNFPLKGKQSPFGTCRNAP